MLFCEAFRCQVKIWRCLLGDSCENWGSRRVCKLLSGRFHWAIVRPGYFWGWCLLMLPESASLVSRCVGNSKSVLLAKRLFSQEEWVCALVCSLGSALGVVAWQEQSFQLLLLWSSGTSGPLTTRARWWSHVPCRDCTHLLALARQLERWRNKICCLLMLFH